MDEMIFVPHAPLFVAAANASAAAAAAGVQGHVSRKAATAREGGREGVCGEEEPGNDPREQDGNAC